MLSTLLLGTLGISSGAFAAEIKIPKALIIELVEERCSLPKPNPRVRADLEYECSDKYEYADGDEQSMNYSLRLLPLIAQDFNKDGIQDLALEIESSGPLGGSVYTNSAIHYLILDNKQKIVKDHEILLYAPFSEHIVEYSIVGKNINYQAIPNYRSHPEAYEDGSPIDPPLEFAVNWVNGVPISTYYRDNCRLAGIKNKTLLKLTRGVSRDIDIDMHEYTQVITEKAQINKLQVTATLDGCDTSNVIYDIKPIAGQSLPVLADVLTALIPVVHHDGQLKALLKLDKRSQLKFGDRFALYDDWVAMVHVDRKSKMPTMRIIIEQKVD
ncbi:hypothetical protein [Psychrobacter urativorans]|uniref:Uncharacterized protein n=1 Tax=Psychrobacter urativorans TaxID=45610 RepID=A0A0M4SYY9_9GAMM|nr:hypothetical protein [Psychrobacter urativorans]ALF60360.1 hypothetical protein AOC03_10170 [Psychrobacter urativorans]